MTKRPILFSGEMVRAILDGRKTMTRRVIKPQPEIDDINMPEVYKQCLESKNPYGMPGDHLWVRERHFFTFNGRGLFVGYADNQYLPAITGDDTITTNKWRPSIHMPRWASRITLEITSVRVERIQDISETDAMHEGIEYQHMVGSAYHRTQFKILWDSINARRGYSWNVNPWIWVISFKRIEACQ